ncbi:MAG: hypothetical protein FWH11_08530 [Micrococcales bacterium]|nr:hypothetical protein [Micrococcales bacterium]
MTCLLASALLALTLGGCDAEGSTADQSAGTTHVGTDVRERLATGLAAVGSDGEMVADARTTLTPVEAAWLHEWQVFDIQLETEYRFARFYAALSNDGATLDLSGSPESFAQMVRSAQVVVNDAAVAIDVGNVYLDVTRTFDKASYRIGSISEVHWLPNPVPADEQRRADLEAQYDALVQPSVAEPSGTGWTVTVWMVYDRTLVRHNLEIAADGVVQDNPEVVETDLPVPYSRGQA